MDRDAAPGLDLHRLTAEETIELKHLWEVSRLVSRHTVISEHRSSREHIAYDELDPLPLFSHHAERDLRRR
jgi:hypothetical protein